jgi:MFS superfamily sulfate permease-like transporter
MGVIVYFFMGTSKDIALGPTALMSLIVAESFDELPHPYNDTHFDEFTKVRDVT